MAQTRRVRATPDPYAEESQITRLLAHLAVRADQVLETQAMIRSIEGELEAEKKALLAETKLFNSARDDVLKVCPEVATGFLQVGETMKVVDGKLVIVPVP